jgi:ATP-dependent helicase/nuclease subunit A
MTSSAYAQAQAAQSRAADPDLNVFVTANAGSGKTKVLIDRIARLLLRGSKPSSFLCITYTKAAAAEMQRRLFARLGGWCVADDVVLAKELGDLTGHGGADSGDLARARALFAQALETPGGLKIQTIHAFCERLLARFPLEARTPPGFEIADDTRERDLVRTAWDGLYKDELAMSALGRLGARTDQGRLEQMLKAALKARKAFAAIVAEAGGVEPAAAAARLRFGPPSTREQLCDELIQGAPWPELSAAIHLLNGKSKSDTDQALAIARAIETRDPDDYLAIFRTLKGEPRSRLATVGVLRENPALARLFGEAGEPARVDDIVGRLRAAERGCDAEALVLLAGALTAGYERMKDQRAILDFDDLIDRAVNLLEDPSAGSWVLYKLDGGIDHILIDEGQDTSPSQWRLLAPLRDEFFAGEGGQDNQRTVFAVGDPKQSIYSFQGADPGRFLDENQALSQSVAAAGAQFVAPALTMSFRSAPEILAAVDATFAALEFAGSPPALFDKVRHSAWREGAKGRVEWWPVAPRPEQSPARAWDAPRDQEPDDSAPARLAQAIAARIVSMLDDGAPVGDDKGGERPMSAGDVLILVRSRGPLFLHLLRACKRAGLPVAGADKLRLADDLAVQDLLTLARVALDPFDDLALACLLKGPWVGLLDDEQDLFPLAAGRAKGETLWDRLMATPDLRYAEAKRLALALRSRRDWPSFEFFAYALEMPGEDGRSGWRRVFERLGPEAADPIQELLNRALGASARGEAGLQGFLGAIAADDAMVKRELEGAGSAVRIMTVHGAKGLEAPVVFLPDTTEAPDLEPSSGLMIEGSLVTSTVGGAKEDDPVSAEIRAAFAARALGEHWRLLYVAMTRARDWLILCGHGRGKGMGKAEPLSWHMQTAHAMEQIGAPCDTPFGKGWRLGDPPIAKGKAATVPSTPAIPLPAWAFAAMDASANPEAAIRPSRALSAAVLSPRAGAARVRRGALIHGLLQRLPDIVPTERQEAGRQWLLRQGQSPQDMTALLDEALAVIENPLFAMAFGPGSRAEAPIIAHVRGRRVQGVIDRLVVTDAEAQIIDFKTDRPPPADATGADPAYLLQMALYREALRQVLGVAPVRCAFVWTFAPALTPIPDALMDESLRKAGLD